MTPRRRGRPLFSGLLALACYALALLSFVQGPRRVAACSTDGDGHVTIGQRLNSLCEVPNRGTVILTALFLGLAIWATVRFVRARRRPATE